MGIRERTAHELKAVVLTTLYFAVWFGVLVALKRLILVEYEIQFRGLSLALMAALVVAKVVLILEHVSLGQWANRLPAVADVVARTVLYAAGVFIALLLEKSFEARHEYGGFGVALRQIFEHRDMPHVWANTICVSCALLAFNALTIVREHVGDGQLIRLFARPRDKRPRA